MTCFVTSLAIGVSSLVLYRVALRFSAWHRLCYNGDGPRGRTTMNAHTLRVLEYEQIKTMLAGYASCELGKRVVAGLEPRCEEEAVRRALQETSEAQRLIDVAGSIPLGGVHDVREAVRAAQMGSLLEATTLLSVADTF